MVTTDASGVFSDLVPNGAQVGPNVDYYVYTNDNCNPSNWLMVTLSNNQGTTTSGAATFTTCANTSSNCQASFYGVDSANNGSYYFVDMSYGSTITYAWDFGDGNTSNLQNPVNNFANGTYTVCLTITTPTCTDTYCQTITVGGPTCNANFYTWVDSTNSTIYLIDLSNNSNGNLNYFWDFGDGNTSNLQYPTHTYANLGIYNICLTVSDFFCTSTYCDSIGITQFMTEESRSGFTLNVIPPSTLGMEAEINSISGMNLYPNPATENISVEYLAINAGNNSITIHDIAGKIIYRENFTAQKGNNRKQIDLSAFEGGMYMLTIADENGKQNMLRIIKE
jgi:PKD repeat protein